MTPAFRASPSSLRLLSRIPPRRSLAASAVVCASSRRSAQANQRKAGASRKSHEERFNYVPNPFDDSGDSVDANLALYPLVSAKQLAPYSLPPKRVRLLVRDFIDDALYNPNYGYFTQQAVIFDPDAALANGQSDTHADAEQPQPVASTSQEHSGFDFNAVANSAAFDREVARRYGMLEGQHGATALPGKDPSSARQIWHTPTELFKPWYARGVARFLVDQHQSSPTPSDDLVIYELGAGNGTLMRGVLDYLSTHEPELYQRTKYHIIEISPRLSALQRARAQPEHADKVQVINEDIFNYSYPAEQRNCFFLAFEVLDNLSHDVVRFTKDPAYPPTPLQASVSISDTGDFVELYAPVSDPVIAEYLSLREGMDLHPLYPHRPDWLRRLEAMLPFNANLSEPFFVPTKLLTLFNTLHQRFPKHRLLLSDFTTLPDATPGHTAPVVQTRYKGQTVPCTTYLVQQGFFDIFFPTDFSHLQHLYEAVRRKSSNVSGVAETTEAPTKDLQLDVLSHRQFLERWGEVQHTALQNGDNPMLEHYENAAFAFSK